MSAKYSTIRHRPVAHWTLDDDSPFTDYSGYGKSASSNTQPVKHTAISHGAQWASIFNSGCVGTFTSSVYKAGKEKESWTIGANIAFTNTAFDQKILSNTGGYDGIYINGNTIYFKIAYATAGSVVTSYTLQDPQNCVVYGVYGVNMISLYVNGVLVDEEEVSEAQLADSFAYPGTSLVCGTTTDTKSVAVNSVSMFEYALPGNSILDIYNKTAIYSNIEESSNYLSGQIVNVEDLENDVVFNQTWDYLSWNFGIFNNTLVEDGDLIPVVQNEILQTGDWMDSIDLSSIESTTIYEVIPDWNGEDALIEFSLDGTAWETAVRNKGLTLITSGTTTVDKTLQIRVSFSSTKAFLENVSVKVYETGQISFTNGRTITLTGNSYPGKMFSTKNMNKNSGVWLDTGTATITSGGTITAGTYEIWLQKTGSTVTITPTGTNYINGSASALTNLRTGEWALVHVVAGSATNSNLVLTGTFKIGRVVFYPTVLTAAQVLESYKAYTGQNVAVSNDVSALGITDSAAEPALYAYDWTIING